MSRYNFDFIIIGSGAAGSTVALNTNPKKHKVAIIESGIWGGDRRCKRDIPFSAALNFSHLYHQAQTGIKMGISSANLRFNYPTILNWQKTSVSKINKDTKKQLEENGITCYSDSAHFLNPHTIAVNGKQLTAAKFLIATGASTRNKSITNLENVEYLTPEQAIKIPKKPKNVFIIGAGSTGCELAQYFAEIGTKVILAEAFDRILPQEDPEIGQYLEKFLKNHHKIKTLNNAEVVALENDEKRGKKIIFVQDNKEKSTFAETVILATGSKPNIDLGLENTGVKIVKEHIKVDRTLQTNVRHIWAAGNVIGGQSSVEKANYEGLIATNNMVKNGRALANYAGFIRTTNTFPQIAKVGHNESECKQLGQKTISCIVPLPEISQSTAANFQAGFLKLTTDKKGTILGATAMMPNANLVLQEIAFAIRHGLSAAELASTPHSATEWSNIVRIAARKLRF